MFTKPLYWVIPVSIMSILASAPLSADPPRKLTVGMFQKMINNSPFTVKPEKAVIVQESPLERDWTLASISPGVDGFSVTLMNKKDRTDRIRFLPGFSAGEYKLLEVKQDFASRDNSKVYIQKGSQKAWIGYDDVVVKLKSKVPSALKKAGSPTRPSIINKLPPGVKIPSTTESKTGTPAAKPVPTRRVRRVPVRK